MQKSKPSKHTLRMAVLAFILLCMAVADILFGTVVIPLSSFLNIFANTDTESYALIIKEFRIPKMLTSVFVGAALSVAGLLMQTLFRNPLADAYILGISSGASLAVALFVISGVSFFAIGGTAISAALGSGLVLLLILLVSIRVNHISTVLILGVLLSSIISAIITILQYFSPSANLQRFVIWTMGSLNTLGYHELKFLIPTVLAAIFGTMLFSRQLDISQMGDSYAKSVGLNLTILKIAVIVAVALLAGTSTAFAGPVGFIGMIVPHIARSFFQTSKHKILIRGTAIIGSIFLILADILAQIPGSPLPVNAVTALLGIPILVYIIVKSKL